MKALKEPGSNGDNADEVPGLAQTTVSASYRAQRNAPFPPQRPAAARASKTTLRILIAPNLPCPYDQRMVKGLAAGFNSLGHYAAALLGPVSAPEIVKMCESLSVDVVLQINRTRDPGIPFPPRVRHIAWFQDVFPETVDGFAQTFHASDILYGLSDPEVLGLRVKLPCYVRLALHRGGSVNSRIPARRHPGEP